MDDRHGAVHAIVVNFRTPDLTIGAVASLLAGGAGARDLVVRVVDNGSGDASVERIRARFPELRLIASPRNLGFAGGNNLALREVLAETASLDATAARDSFVLLLNSDVVVEPDALATALAFMDRHPEAGVVGPRVLLPDGRLDLACRRGFPTPARAFWKLTGIAKRRPRDPRFSGYNLTHLDEDATVEVDAVMGAFMLVRLAAVRDAGILDDEFFMYGEDIDWAWRLRSHGWRVWYVPAARVRHLKGASSRRQSERMIWEFYRAMWLFYRKHQAARNPRVLRLLVYAGIVVRGAIALAVNATRPPAARRVT